MAQPTVASSISIASVSSSLLIIAEGIASVFGKTIDTDVLVALNTLIVAGIHFFVHVKVWGLKKTAEEIDSELSQPIEGKAE